MVSEIGSLCVRVSKIDKIVGGVFVCFCSDFHTNSALSIVKRAQITVCIMYIHLTRDMYLYSLPTLASHNIFKCITDLHLQADSGFH